MSVRHALKGFETHMHDTAREARECFELGGPDRYFAMIDARDEYDPDRAYELHLETRDWAEQEAFADHERAAGCEDFIDAWHRESPQSCPCPNH